MKSNKVICRIIMSIGICFTACSSGENKTIPTQPSQPIQDTEVADPGKKIFEEKCMVCHGSDGTAGIANAANLRTSKLDDAAITQTITNGKNSMPAFGNQLTTTEIEQISNYVHSLRK